MLWWQNVSPQLLWFLAGTVLLIAEALLPGVVLIFFALGCWLTAFLMLIFNFGYTIQVSYFILTSLIMLFTLRRHVVTFRGEKHQKIVSEDDTSGKKAEVTEKITPPHSGQVKALGSYWPANADQVIDVGTTVIIKGRSSEDPLTLEVYLSN